MSSTVAKPVSTIRIADNRYGTSSALTTNPERSADRITCLPNTSWAKVSARSLTSVAVSNVVTSSTSGSTGTGLKKCMVLDIACGPGNYTRDIAAGLTGDGRVVGIDYSPSMLHTAVATNSIDRASYLRVDAHAIPFADNTFDEVICLAALYLIPDPLPVLDEMLRVAFPGALLVVFTSVAGPVSTVPGVKTLAAIGGYRVFGRDEITGALRRGGAEHIEQTIIGEGQYVLARAPGGN